MRVYFSNFLVSLLCTEAKLATVLSNDDSVYSYDRRQRLRRKKLPGIEAEEYVYDNCERLALSRDITSITYNALNLPETITFSNGSTVSYQYAADGTRLSESTYEKKENGMGATLSPETATDILSSDLNPIGPITPIEPGEELGITNDTYYAGSYEFGSFGKPQRLLLGGGYLTLSDNIYHHYVTDYQGNVVLVINTKERSIEQQTGYYPYGMPHGDAVGADAQPNKYSGKRLQTFAGMDTYDFHARQLPIGIPRFDRPDPLAHKYTNIGLYTFCAGDPVNHKDRTGKVLEFQNIVETDKVTLKISKHVGPILLFVLNALTGFNLYFDDSYNLICQVDENDLPIIRTMQNKNGETVYQGSATARAIVYAAIQEDKVYKVKHSPSPAYKQSTGEIGIGLRFVLNMMKSAFGVDPNTVGLGITVLHEILHAILEIEDIDDDIGTGPIVDIMNKVREEMNENGENYGIRMNYKSMPSQKGNIIPFSERTFQKILEDENAPLDDDDMYIIIPK